MKKTRRIIITVGVIMISLLLVLFLAGTVYINSLTSLYETGEVTADPTIQESDLIVSSETVNETDSTSQMTEAVTEQSQAELIPLRSDSQVYNILLIGADPREGETNGRSDAMIILSVNKRTHKIHIVSLERALYVDIPGRDFYMLNASYSYGGSKLLRETIEKNLRVHIDDYVRIDLTGFVAAIDTVGGLDISLTDKEVGDINSRFGISLLAGMNHLDGNLALAYSRIRKIDSDYARTGRQRKVIECLISKMGQLDPVTLDATLRQILPNVKTNLSAERVIGLAIDALTFKDYPISQLLIPIKGTYETIVVRNMQVVQFDFAQNVAALQSFLYDD